MRIWFVPVFLVLALLASVVACASRTNTTTSPPSETLARASAPAQLNDGALKSDAESWEGSWSKVVEAAQKERTLFAHVGGTMSIARESMQSRFKDKYGITLDIFVGGSTETLQRLKAERRAGLKLVDIKFGGAATFLTEIIPGDLVEPLDTSLILPEVKDPKVWRNQEIPFINRGHNAIAFSGYVSGNLAVNTNLVKSDEITSYQDMMNPKWKKKILTLDPTMPGSGEKFWTVTGAVHKDWDWVREFVTRQEPVVTRDRRLILDWVAQGKAALSIGSNETLVWEYSQAGAPIGWAVLKDGGYTTVGSAVIGIVKDAPHPNAAKVFLNWLLSKEGQSLVTPYVSAPSWRFDVSTEGLNPVLVPEPGRKYFKSDSEEFTLKYDDFRKINNEIWNK